jgi:hypothetical protein
MAEVAVAVQVGLDQTVQHLLVEMVVQAQLLQLQVLH